jgi:hypothetical protein
MLYVFSTNRVKLMVRKLKATHIMGWMEYIVLRSNFQFDGWSFDHIAAAFKQKLRQIDPHKKNLTWYHWTCAQAAHDDDEGRSRRARPRLDAEKISTR